MELTNPFTGMFVPRKMTNLELANAIRLDIMAELDATSLYLAHMAATDNPDAKAILAHIAREEQEHAAEFLELLKTLDPGQAAELEKAAANFEEVTGHPPGVAASPQGAEASSPTQSKSTGLTVGDLFMSEPGGSSA